MQSNLIGSCLKGVAAACVAVLSVSGSAFGATRNVPSDYSTLEAAIAAADDNDEIVISTGTYELAAEISIARPLTIRSATGKPEDVIVTLPDKAGCRHFTLNNAEVGLCGLTLTNGSQSASWSSGGSVYFDKNGGTVSNCVFIGNNQNGWDALGGAIGIASAKALVTHCLFTKNLAKGGGGSSAGGNAIHMTAAGMVRNCLFVGNGDSTVTTGKGGTVLATAGTVESCTFANNENATCAGVRVDGNNVIVRNCIFCGADCPKASSELVKVMNDPARTGRFFNCCAPVLINDSCIASVAPLADAAVGDWTPSASIVDQGLKQDWMTDATDFAGASRIAGEGPDIGCFERDPSKFGASVEPSGTAGPAPLAVTFKVTAYGVGASGITCHWDWNGDGDWDDTSDGTTAHSFDAGSYSVKVKVVDNETKKEYARVTPFEIASAPKTIYVDGDSTDPVSPYGDPEHAAQTVADAYAVAVDGCEIVIASNTYSFDAQIEVTKSVTFRSQTGNPADVILTMPDKANRRHFILNHAEATLCGLTLTNAYNNNGNRESGGSVLMRAGGTISNCVFASNLIPARAGKGGAIYMEASNSLVTHCTFTGNRSMLDDGGNGGNAIGMSAGDVRNCLFVGNGERSFVPGKCGTVYMDGGTVENCTFANNEDGKCAGVSIGNANATVRNCVFYGADCPNAASELGKIMNDTTKAGRFFNCCAPVEINTTCVVAAEPFVDASHGDWNPAGSIVDKGVASAWMTDVTDLAGNPRISGTLPDIGCYEKDQSKFSPSVEPSSLSGISPYTVTFTVTPYGAGAEGVTCYWDWDGDGTCDDTSDGTTNHVFEGGAFATKVKVVDNASQQSYEPTSPFALTIVPKTIYVDANSTAPVAPYNDPAHAAQTVADAYAVAQDGCEIVIASGTCPVDAEIEVLKGVTFRGATGNPADVILTITNNTTKVGHRHFILNHGKAALCGLTLTGAAQRNDNREHGGSVLVRSQGGTISNCVFSGNSTLAWAGQGGAIYLNSADALVTHCVFTDNCSANTDVNNGGNAIGMVLGNVRNCLFIGNGTTGRSPGKCGTVYMTGGTIENCTFANNEDGKCAGVSVGNANATIRNCIFYGELCPNADSELGKIMYDTTKAARFSNCCAPVEINSTCIVAAEPFVDAAHGDWNPSGSIVDKGVESAWMADATDLAGNPRLSGTLPDIGCYEKDQSKFGASVEPNTTTGIEPCMVTFTVTPYGIVTDGVTCYWDWDGDGSWDATTDGTTSHSYATGAHSTKVKVVDNATEEAYEPAAPFVVTVVPKTIYVDGSSTAPLAPYGDRDHAAQSVADAYAIAQGGCEIVIASGTYAFDSEIEVLKGVTFRGQTGNPADVILTITNNTSTVGHRHFIMNHEDSRLCGLTLTGAAQRNNNREHGGSVLVRSRGATISNCVFRGNSTLAWAAQGGAIYLNSADALVTHCVFTNNCSANTDANNGGNAIGMAAGNVRNSLFVGNGERTRTPGKCGTVYMTGGTIENCTFANNADGKCAGVSVNSANATVGNCIFYGADCPNASSELVKIVNDASKVSRFFNCCAPVEIGTACVKTDDPEFRNEARGNYRLKADSPAVNKGVWCNWMDGATDLGGNPRKVGKLPDIGCYECLGGGFRLIVR